MRGENRIIAAWCATPCELKAIDRTRELARSVLTLPFTGTPPFQVEFDMERHSRLTWISWSKLRTVQRRGSSRCRGRPVTEGIGTTSAQQRPIRQLRQPIGSQPTLASGDAEPNGFSNSDQQHRTARAQLTGDRRLRWGVLCRRVAARLDPREPKVPRSNRDTAASTTPFIKVW